MQHFPHVLFQLAGLQYCLFSSLFFLCSLSFYVHRILLLSFSFSWAHCTVCYFEWILLNEKIISSLTSHSAKEMCSPSEESATHTFLPGPFRILFRRTGEHRIQSEFSVLLQIKSVLSSIQLSVCVCESYYNHYAKFATTLFFLWSSHTYICFCKQLTTAFPVKQWHFCMHRWFSSSLRRRHHLSFHHRMPSKFRCIFVSLQQISCYFQIIATYKTQFVLLFFRSVFSCV